MVGLGGRLRIGALEAHAEQDRGHGDGGKLVGQRGAEKAVGHQSVINTAQTVEGQVSQASTHRVTDQQGPGQNG